MLLFVHCLFVVCCFSNIFPQSIAIKQRLIELCALLTPQSRSLCDAYAPTNDLFVQSLLAKSDNRYYDHLWDRVGGFTQRVPYWKECVTAVTFSASDDIVARAKKAVSKL
jgi:hypothetical protein